MKENPPRWVIYDGYVYRNHNQCFQRALIHSERMSIGIAPLSVRRAQHDNLFISAIAWQDIDRGNFDSSECVRHLSIIHAALKAMEVMDSNI